MHFLHLLGAITWVGGMLATGLVVLPVLRGELREADRDRVVDRIGRRFRTVEAAAWACLLISGLFKLHAAGPDPWFPPTAFARILALKLALVAAVVTLAVLHGYVWGPRLGRMRTRRSAAAAALTRRIVFWVRIEAALALGVVVCGALLRVNPF